MKKLLTILASISILASGSSSVMAMSKNTKINDPEFKQSNLNHPTIVQNNKLTSSYSKIIDVPKTATVVIGTLSSVIINNFNDLTNVKVESLNTEIVTATLLDNRVELDGLKIGTATVKVSADEAEDALISVTVEELKKIDVDQNAEVYVLTNVLLQIRNASELTGLFAQSSDEKIATALIRNDDTVEIRGWAKGTVDVIVGAKDAESAIITVTVQEFETIQIDRDQANIIVGNMTDFKITNLLDLKNVGVKSQNPQIATATLIEDVIWVRGVGLGTTTVLVYADNAYDVPISVTVNNLMPIEVDKESVEVYVNGSEQVTITNFLELEAVDVRSNDTTVAVASINDEGLITIQGNSVGTTNIVIKAKDASEKAISVTVNDLKTIIVDKESTEVYATETTNVQIKNAPELMGIDVKSSNEQIATASLIDTNKIAISGLTFGQVEITISALNAKDKTISVTVNDLKTIIVDKEVNIVTGSNRLVEIINFQELSDVKVKSADPKIAAVGLMENSLLILGNAEGTTTITVSANRAWETIITVTVSPLKMIEVDKESVEIDENGSDKVKITNFSDLTNVDVKSNNALIATANVDNQGTITIQAHKLGKTIINITAQDAFKKEISVEVTELDKIIVDRDMVDLYGLQTELVNITNFFDLTNVGVKSNNNKIVEVVNHKNGVVSIIRGVDANTGDEATVEITADHATKTTISVSIKAQIPLTKIIKTLALDSENEDQVIDEVVKKNYGLTKEDIKIKEGSFKAPNSEELKLGEVIIESNTLKYGGEIKLLLVPQMPTDPRTEELMLKIKNGKDLEERKPYWKEYFEYKGVLFFEKLMPKNPWNFKENEFEIDANGNKKLKLEVFELISRYLDAVVQRSLWQDYDKYEVKQDYYNFDYVALKNYQTTVEENLVTIQFKGYYDFMLNDNSLLRIYFDNNIKGTISE